MSRVVVTPVRANPVTRSHVEQRHAGTRAPSKLGVLGSDDFGWIAEAIDHVTHAEGQPWRVALEAIDGLPVSKRNIVAVRSGIARVLGGAGRLTAMARRVRELVLGRPALDGDLRAARVAIAAAQLGVANEEVDGLMFMDLPGERSIVLRRGRPSEIEVAAFGNVVLIQRALRRAFRVRLWLWDDDGTLLRAALARGLLVTASRDPETCATMLEIVGPLALFQRTAVYGRALGQLVPLLAASARFALELETTQWRSRLESPVLLPRAPIDRRGTYEPTKLARALARFDPQLPVFVGPPPIVTQRAILCPDLEICYGDERWYIELVGFWTTEHVAKRLATYAEAGVLRVLFCLDEARSCADDNLAAFTANVLRYTRRIDPSAVVAMLASANALPASSGPRAPDAAPA
ncbi:hypothetical protein BH11MYX1_BH11MYX1_49490 [soil metagenome]